MLRSSRLITSEIELLHGDNDVQTGDIMTGWEIVASMPLEAQTSEESKMIPDAVFSVAYCDDGKIPLAMRVLYALSKLYRWNGELWEVVDGRI